MDFFFRSNRENSLDNKYGFAGYDNALPSMESVLILAGPDIRADGLESAGGNHVNAVDVFPLLAHLLGNSSLYKVERCLPEA